MREVYANTLVDTLISQFDASTGQIPSLSAFLLPKTVLNWLLIYLFAGLKDQGDQSAYLMAAIARTDSLSRNTTFKDLVMNHMDTVFSLNSTINE